MDSTAGASKKKRDRTKDRQRRKEKQQEKREDSDSSGEDIPPNAIYGPRGETKRQYDARVGDQPVHDASWSAFQRRAKARKGKPIEYEHAVFPVANVLHVDASSALDFKSKVVKQLSFAPTINVDDAIIDVIAKSDAEFRNNLQAFVAGDATREQAIDITDAGVEKLVKACPNLTAVTLHGTRNLASKAFPAILKNCASIEAVTITVAKENTSTRTKLTSSLDWLTDKDFVPKLRYLEFRGVNISPDRRNFLDFLTKRRHILEIVYEYGREAVLIRDMESVLLARVPQQSSSAAATSAGKLSKATAGLQDMTGEMPPRPGGSSSKAKVEEDDEDAWEDEDSDSDDDDDDFDFDIDEDLISDDPKVNARMLRRLGQRSALSDALGRDLHDFEMDSDYGDYDDDIDSGEEMSPQETREMLKLYEMMGAR